MRWLVLALLALPLATAQAPDLRLLEVSVEDPPLVAPLKAAVTANVTTRVSCALADAGGRVQLQYAVAEAPAWAQVVISPSSDVANPASCEAGTATRTATLILTASDQAPAYRAAPLRIRVTAGSEGRQETAEATANATAGYFSILDAQTVKREAVARPGEEVAYPLRLTNFGNGETRVSFEVADQGPGLTVTLPDPVVLASKQQGATSVGTEVEVRVRTKEASGVVHRVDVVVVRILGENAERPGAAQDTDVQTTAFTITTQNGIGRVATPAVGAAALVGLLGFLAYATRRD